MGRESDDDKPNVTFDRFNTFFGGRLRRQEPGSYKFITSGTEVIATLRSGSPAATPAQPVSMVFNGLTVYEIALSATDEREHASYRIPLWHTGNKETHFA